MDDAHLLPQRMTTSSAGFDFKINISNAALSIKPFEFVKIPSGVRLSKSFPNSKFVWLTHRSSIFKRVLLINAVIDADYTDEIFIGTRNITNTLITLHNRERVAQGIVLEYGTDKRLPFQNRIGGFFVGLVRGQ